MPKRSLEHLKNIPLFHSMEADDLAKINAWLSEVSFLKGALIIEEGEIGDCMYIIDQGRVKVTSKTDDDDEIILSFLSRGDYFGEMSLITGEPRSATIIADDAVRLFKLTKKDFDKLILNNPQITLSLTHMLSHRLRLANKARESTERYYKHQISPRGKLDDVNVFDLLRFAEENALTGKLTLNNFSRHAYFHYRKGQLLRLEYENKDEDEAMDEILEWNRGSFKIEPELFKLPSGTGAGTPEKIVESTIVTQNYENYISEKLQEFIRLAGSRITQAAINKAYARFENYFDIAREVKIQALPELLVKLTPETSWSEKHTLFIAVLLRDIVQTMEHDLVGMHFWKKESRDDGVNEKLEDIHFFTYFDQAVDFIGK